MSESAILKELETNTNCPICLEQYCDPKILFCRHTFCKECVRKVASRSHDKTAVPCPSCRKTTALPEGGVGGLEPAFHIRLLIAVKNSFETRHQGDAMMCEKHKDQKIVTYCSSCKTLVCSLCVAEEHNHHTYKKVDDVYETYKEELATELQAAIKVLMKVDLLMVKFQNRGEEISMQADSLEDEINGTIDRLQQALEKKRSSLINEVKKLTSKKLTLLNMKKSEINQTQIQLESNIKEGQYLLEESKETVLMKKEVCADSIKRAILECRDVNSKVPDEESIRLAENFELALQSVENFASIAVCNCYPQKCYARGNGMSSASVDETATITVHAMDAKTQPCSDGILDGVKLDVIFNDEIVESNFAKRTKENLYDVSYTPKSKGYHNLHITIRGQHIYGSPFQVAVKSSTLSSPIQVISTVPNPSGIALDDEGNLLVLSESTQRIVALNQAREKIRETAIGPFTDFVIADGKVMYAVSADENLVAKFTPDGTLMKTTAELDASQLTRSYKFNAPKGITYNHHSKQLYVSNTNSHEIIVLDEYLNYCKTIGREGTGKLQFKYPRGICCDIKWRIIVADSLNDRIQVFTAEGKWLRMFGHSGDRPGHLKWPLGVATDASRQIYVAEGHNHRVSVFGYTGNFLKVFGEEGVMQKPMGIAVDSNCGIVFVCNSDCDEIHAY